jgi:hypothetical protein
VSGAACAFVWRCVVAPHRCAAAAVARASRPFLRRCDGQSSIELLGAIPLLLIVVLAAAQLLAAGAARVSASSAANAAAMALLQDGDAVAAARAAAPGWAHARVAVRVSGRRARVRLTPPSLLPGLSGLLSTTAEADAGPAQQASSSS